MVNKLGIEAKELATRWVENPDGREPFLLEALFTPRKQMGIKLAYLTGKTPEVKPLSPSSFDAKVIPISYPAFDKIETELPFFKNSLNLNENDVQELLMVLQTGNSAYIDVVYDRLYDRGKVLLENARIVPEIMRAQLLTTGKYVFSGNGQAYSYDFGVENKGSASTAWTSASADPIADITKWQDEVENKTGVRPTGLLMNRNTFNYLAKIDAIKDAIYVLGQGKVTPSSKDVTSYIFEQTSCTIYVYTKGYTDPSTGVRKPFIGDGVVTLFPEDMQLGETVYGTTPEEARLLGGYTDAKVEIVDTGVAITEYVEKDPVFDTVKVSEVVLATLEAADYIYIADVD